MKESNVKDAITEATRFIARAKLVLKEMSNTPNYYWGGKNSAAMKRASLDLSMALAKMRQES